MLPIDEQTMWLDAEVEGENVVAYLRSGSATPVGIQKVNGLSIRPSAI